MKPFFLFLTLILFCFTSCIKKEDVEPPKITLSSPSDKQAFKNGQTVTIKGEMTDNSSIYIVVVTVNDAKTGTAIHQVYEYVHANKFSLNTTFTINETAKTTYKIDVLVGDHDSNDTHTYLDLAIN